MTILKIVAAPNNAGAPAEPSLYPVLLTLHRSDDGVPFTVVGQVLVDERDAGVIAAVVRLVSGFGFQTRVIWAGWEPPATDLPIPKLGTALKLLGIGRKP